MVGDNLRDDVRAAREAGLRAVLLRRDAPELSHREPRGGEPWVGDLAELAGRLEIPGFSLD
jgi:FMN phosphatase YigB (HAD superfamily)